MGDGFRYLKKKTAGALGGAQIPDLMIFVIDLPPPPTIFLPSDVLVGVTYMLKE